MSDQNQDRLVWGLMILFFVVCACGSLYFFKFSGDEDPCWLLCIAVIFCAVSLPVFIAAFVIKFLPNSLKRDHQSLYKASLVVFALFSLVLPSTSLGACFAVIFADDAACGGNRSLLAFCLSLSYGGAFVYLILFLIWLGVRRSQEGGLKLELVDYEQL